MPKQYKAIGLMSGSSLDGLDIAFVALTEMGDSWSYEWIATECLPYPEDWLTRLKNARGMAVPDFLRLHTEYGAYTGKLVRQFLQRHSGLLPDFIASHGHTVFHDPANATTFQLGDGASIAAETSLPVISDLRNVDVAYGGQGAPIVPMGERLLFAGYDYWLNLGGIANITLRENGVWQAFDVCACNQVLNALAMQAGKPYDEGGHMAASGSIDEALLAAMNAVEYFRRALPKSLDNSFSEQEILPLLSHASIPLADKLRTAVEHIATQISKAIPQQAETRRLLATGGGALNEFMIGRLSAILRQKQVIVELPDLQTLQYKEALVMALLGALRMREEETVISSVTGARKSSIGGALWQGRVNKVKG